MAVAYMCDVKPFPRKMVLRECPECGYLMAQTVIAMALFDFPCPDCKQIPISKFLRTTIQQYAQPPEEEDMA